MDNLSGLGSLQPKEHSHMQSSVVEDKNSPFKRKKLFRDTFVQSDCTLPDINRS